MPWVQGILPWRGQKKLVEKSNEGQLSLKRENAVIRPSPNGKR